MICSSGETDAYMIRPTRNFTYCRIRCSSVRGSDIATARTSLRSTPMRTAELTGRALATLSGRDKVTADRRLGLVPDAGVRDIGRVRGSSARYGQEHERTAQAPPGDDGGAGYWDER